MRINSAYNKWKEINLLSGIQSSNFTEPMCFVVFLFMHAVQLDLPASLKDIELKYIKG